MIDRYRLLDRDVVSTKLRFYCKLNAKHHARSFIATALVIVIIAPVFTNNTCAQGADVPNWRRENRWRYNVTIADVPGNHTATVLITEWGEYLDDNKTKFDTFQIYYITSTIHPNDTYGFFEIRDVDYKHITRYDYTIAFSQRNTSYYYNRSAEVTEKRYTKFNPMIDLFNFPIEVGKKWHQTISTNTTTEIKVKKPTYWEVVRDDVTYDTVQIYYECTGMEDIPLNTIDYEEPLLDSSLTANWTSEEVTAFRILEDNEEQDTDGTYTIHFYNITRGNIVRREIWEGGLLNVTWSMVWTDYEFVEDPWEPEDPTEEESPEVMVCIGGLVILAMLILSFIIIRRRSVSHEDRFTKEYIEAIDTKSELIELCEEAKLSAKGAKGQLRKRLLLYVEELDKEKGESKKEDEDFEDEGSEVSEEELEKDLDVSHLEADNVEDAGDGTGDEED